MFQQLLHFGYKRNAKQAFGWYLFWLLCIALGAGIAAGVLGMLLITL
ncbi:MAG: hypothetical protein H6765_00080 [Candidatus Peribacteria bacterium]|nr:MAG: hypothetical protein H6765_00080 [Candidatus Peribacteria bacterium]